MRAWVMDKPAGITRLVQPSGHQSPPRWRDGICVRLPGSRILLVDYWLPRRVETH